MLIDSHCHINSLTPEQRTVVFTPEVSCYCFIDSSINIKTSVESLQMSRTVSFVYSSLGFHPFCASEYNPDIIKDYEKMLEDGGKKVVAIGEIGLDYKAEVSQDKQEEVLRQFIMLAKRRNLPVVIHNRLNPTVASTNYKLRILEILDEFYSSYESVVFHCFSYNRDLLIRIVEKRGMVSFSLNVLRRKKRLLEALLACPLDNLLLETDSPYMRIEDAASTPLDIRRVYDFVADVKKIDSSKLEQVVGNNAKRIFPAIGCL
jgi:TatD DNase family protein